ITPDLNPHGVVVFSTVFQIAGCIGSSLFSGIYTVFSGISMTIGLIACIILVIVLACIGFVLAIILGNYSKQKQILTNATNKPKSFVLDIPSVMFTKVHSVPASASLYEAMQCMIDMKTSGIPVLDAEGHAVGYIVDGDIMRYLTDKHADKSSSMLLRYPLAQIRSSLENKFTDMKSVNVMDIANPNVITVDIHEDINTVVDILSDVRIKKIPVTDNGIVVGAISRSDLMRSLCTGLF
ncbi:MAG TPA: CBS domain-containing protein, partial [Methanocorpusculum sp.]|nr:CBS domain-containing protein [Methanocorpusculum sp.]